MKLSRVFTVNLADWESVDTGDRFREEILCFLRLFFLSFLVPSVNFGDSFALPWSKRSKSPKDVLPAFDLLVSSLLNSSE